MCRSWPHTWVMLVKQIPNVLTILRLVLVPVLAVLILENAFRPALLVAIVAGLSDAADGFLAKRYGWVSWFGSMMDPLADKLLMLTAFICLAIIGLLPWWLFVLTILRDVIIVCGVIFYHYKVEPVMGQPTLSGKLNTVAQIVLVAWCLVGASGFSSTLSEGLPLLIQWLIYTVAALTSISLLQYVWMGVTRTRQFWQQEHEHE